jgi:hypothetical protein
MKVFIDFLQLFDNYGFSYNFFYNFYLIIYVCSTCVFIQCYQSNFISCIVPHVYDLVCICIYYDKFCIHLLDLLNDK